MSLAEKLDAMREQSAKHIPEEKRAILGRANERMLAEGVMNAVPRPGDRLPPFSLENQDGERVRSDDLLGRGPLVLTVFRGHW